MATADFHLKTSVIVHVDFISSFEKICDVEVWLQGGSDIFLVFEGNVNKCKELRISFDHFALLVEAGVRHNTLVITDQFEELFGENYFNIFPLLLETELD